MCMYVSESSTSCDAEAGVIRVQKEDASVAYNDCSVCLILSTVRSHACEIGSYGKPGGCSHICLLSGSYKSRTCRCRTGYRLGSDGQSCKSQ